jgi:hypothetical protein
MSSQTTGLRVAAVVFGLMAVAQLARLLIRPEVLVAGRSLPLWPNALALVLLSALSIWMWRLARTPGSSGTAARSAPLDRIHTR